MNASSQERSDRAGGARARALAERIEAGARELAAFAEGLSDADWKTHAGPVVRNSVGKSGGKYMVKSANSPWHTPIAPKPTHSSWLPEPRGTPYVAAIDAKYATHKKAIARR